MYFPKALDDEFILIDDLGADSLSELYRVKDRNSDQRFIVRIMNLPEDNSFNAEECNTGLSIWFPLQSSCVSFVRRILPLEEKKLALIMDDRPGQKLSTCFNLLHRNPSLVCEMASQLGESLDYLHQNNICHLAVDPDTILVSVVNESYSFSLLDCGFRDFPGLKCLHNMADSRYLTAVSFMSIEYITGRNISHRSDYYSLGIVLFTAATGKNPFEDSTMAGVVSAQLNKQINQVRTLNPSIDEETELFILKCLAKKPEFRPVNVLEFKTKLVNIDKTSSAAVPPSASFFIDHSLPRKEIQSAFEEACRGRSFVLAVTGEAGIGKSDLLKEMAAEFKTSGAFPVIFNSDSGRDSDCGYVILKSLFQALHNMFPRIDPDCIEKMYPNEFSENLLLLADQTHRDSQTHHCAQHLLEGLLNDKKLHDCSPRIFILKNCHFSDLTFWRFWHTLARLILELNAETVPILWLLETRTIHPTFSKTVASGRFRSIELVPGGQGHAEEMLSATFGIKPVPHSVTDYVFKQSRGNYETMSLILALIRQTDVVFLQNGNWMIDEDKILHLLEQSRDLSGLTDWVIENSLSQSQQTLINHVAFWEDGCTIEDLTWLSEPEYAVNLHLHEALSSGWIKRKMVSSRMVFQISNSFFRSRILELIPAYHKQDINLRIAERLENMMEIHAASVSRHFFYAGNRLHGCEYASLAGYYYRDNHCLEKSLFWFERILSSMPERNRTKLAQISLEYGKVLIAAGDFISARRTLIDAEPILDSRFHQKREKAELLMLQGICYLQTREYEEARKLLQEALQYLPHTTGFEYRLKILVYLCQALLNLKDFTVIGNIFNTYKNVLPMADYPFFSCRLLETVAKSYQEQQQFGIAEFYLNESIRYSELAGDTLSMLSQMLALGQLNETSGKYRQAVELFERVIVLARKGGLPLILCEGLCRLSAILLVQQKLDITENYLQEADSIISRIEDSSFRGWVNILKSSVFIKRGMLDEAEAVLQSISERIAGSLEANTSRRIYLNQALIAERRGHFAQMLDVYKRLLSNIDSSEQPAYVAFAYLYLARTHCLLEQPQQATNFIIKARQILEQCKMPVPDCDLLEAMVSIKLSHYKKARKCASNGLEQAKSMNLLHQQAEAFRMLGLIDHVENEFESAVGKFETALSLYNAEHEDFNAAHVHRLLADSFLSLGQLDLSKREHQTADALFARLSAYYYVLDNAEDQTSNNRTPVNAPGFTIEASLVIQLLQYIHDPDHTFMLILHIVLESIKVSRGAILVRQSNSRDLFCAAQIAMDQSVLSEKIRRCSELMFEQKMAEPFTEKIDQENITSAMMKNLRYFIPIIFDNNHGIIILESEPGESEISKNLLLMLSSLVSSALIISGQISRNRSGNRFTESTEKKPKVITESAVMAKLMDAIQSASQWDRSVLITGATGTGKSFIAEYLHYLSNPGSRRPLVVQCQTMTDVTKHGILSEQILSGLHGLESFSDNFQTIILEDVDSLPWALQLELIPFLTGTGFPGNPMNKHVKFILTMEKNIRQEVQAGKFSEDLYRLISDFHVSLPALSERKEDIPHLALSFLQDASRLTHKNFTGFSPQTLDALLSYHWPENVSELKYAVESAVLFGTPPQIQINDLPKPIRIFLERSGMAGSIKPLLRSIEEIEESHIRSILQGTNGNKVRAAELLGISRPTLDRKMEKFGILIQKKSKT